MSHLLEKWLQNGHKVLFTALEQIINLHSILSMQFCLKILCVLMVSHVRLTREKWQLSLSVDPKTLSSTDARQATNACVVLLILNVLNIVLKDKYN